MTKNRLVIDVRKTAQEVFEKMIEPELLEKGISEELIHHIKLSCTTWDENFIMELAKSGNIYPTLVWIDNLNFGMPSRIRIKDFLEENKNETFTYIEIAERLQLIPNTTYQLLHRMMKKGEPISFVRGVHGTVANRYGWKE